MRVKAKYLVMCLLVMSCALLGIGEGVAHATARVDGLPCNPTHDLPVCDSDNSACYCVTFDDARHSHYVCAECPQELSCDSALVTCVMKSPDTKSREMDTTRDNPLYRAMELENPLFAEDP